MTVLAIFFAALPPSMHFQMLDGMHILGPSPHCPMAAIGDWERALPPVTAEPALAQSTKHLPDLPPS